VCNTKHGVEGVTSEHVLHASNANGCLTFEQLFARVNAWRAASRS
jgi:hypothetical protein